MTTGQLAGTDILDASMLIMLVSHLRTPDECTRDIPRGRHERVAGHNNRSVFHAKIVGRLDALHERVNALQSMLCDKVGFSYRSAMTLTWEGVAGTRSGQGVY